MQQLCIKYQLSLYVLVSCVIFILIYVFVFYVFSKAPLRTCCFILHQSLCISQ